MVRLRRCAPALLCAFLVTACRDPAPSTGTLVVEVTGLPSGAQAAVRVMGPNQFIESVRSTTTLENLVPGNYVVARDSVTVSSTRFGVDSASVRDTIAIARGRTVTTGAAYVIASGSLNLTINGLPNGVLANLTVTGPGTPPYNQSIGGSTLLTGLRPGVYQVRADSMMSFVGDRYMGLPLTQNITVAASLTPVEGVVNYFLTSGSLSLTVNGLPASITSQPIRVTGPGSYDVRTTQSVVYRGLIAGTYTITASNIQGACPNVYSTADASQTSTVNIGETSSATISYAQSQVAPADLNLGIQKVLLTQASQNPDGTVPLISGKTALVRVFGIANQCNTAKPKVRVTLSTGFQTLIDAPEDSVRVTPDETKPLTTWNAVVPGNLVQTGMTIVAEMDQTNLVTEANETDNRLPASGGKAVDVRVVPTVGLRLVPITQTVNGSPLTGDVTANNLDLFMDWPRKIHPVGNYDVEIRDPYTTTTGALGSSGTNWNQVLNEINALRQSDQSLRYYYGVAKVTYNSGVAGIAFVPGKAGMGWDYVSANSANNSASRVMAHELGHSYGRLHTPCGNPAGIDGGYPTTGAYAGGKIGVFGWDPLEGFKAADQFTDIMGYCNSQWISDYTYMGMLNWLLDPSHNPSLPSVSGAEQPSLLIWGRIENGQPVLEPTFEISARPSLPPSGPNRISAADASGAELFGVSFAGDRIADLPGDAESFAFTVPVSALGGKTLASLRLTARGGKSVSSVASSDVAADASPALTRVGSNAVRVRWDAARFPVVMVRDPVRGQVLSFARGGDVTIQTQRTELELNFSNRLRSSRRLTQLK